MSGRREKRKKEEAEREKERGAIWRCGGTYANRGAVEWADSRVALDSSLYNAEDRHEFGRASSLHRTRDLCLPSHGKSSLRFRQLATRPVALYNAMSLIEQKV